METKEIRNVEYLRKLLNKYRNTSKASDDKTAFYTAEIKLVNYYELGCVITDMIKLCILSLDQDAQNVSDTVKKSSVNVARILEVALQLFPLDEFELLTEINDLVVADSNNND